MAELDLKKAVSKPEPLPEADGTVYFKPDENCTIIHPEGFDPETKRYEKHHFITLKKGVVYGTNLKHEIEALKKRGFKIVSKPKPKPKVEDDE